MQTQRYSGGFLAAMAIALLLQSPAFAQDADTQEVLRYTLTEAGLTKYINATKKLATLPDSCEDDADDEATRSIADMVAKIDGTPGAKAAIQSAGMTTREYAVFSMAMIHNSLAAWAVSQPGGKLPPGVSQANVDFLKRNEAKTKELEGLGRDGCGDQASEDEEIEEGAVEEG
jgi:hypothetical protein